MLELILGILLAAGAMYFVLLPILRPPIEAPRGETPVDEGDDPADDMSAQAVATGKLSDTDYEQLKAKYTAEALAAMRGERTSYVVRRTSELPAPARRTTHDARCLQHGPRPEKDAQFCSDCGRRLGNAPGYCTRCGSTLQNDARYCNACGARVAA